MTALDIASLLKDYGPWGLNALFLLAIIYLSKGHEARDKRHEALLERVIVVAEGYKVSVTTIATAVDGFKAVQTSLVDATRELSREAEGDNREVRHMLSNLMQVVTSNLEMLKKFDSRRENV
jgi:hypothetical protein